MVTTAATAAPRRRRARGGGRTSRAVYWAYLVPGAVLFVAVIVVPFVMNTYLSFTRWPGIGDPRWAGLDNYTRLLADETFWTSFRNSVAMIVAMVVVPTLIGLVLAAIGLRKVGRMSSGSAWAVVLAFYLLGLVFKLAFAAIMKTPMA